MAAAMVAAALALAAPGAAWAQAMNFDPDLHGVLWPNTDLTKTSVSFDEVFSGGVPRDGIPPIDDPITGSIEDVGDFFGATAPVITVVIEGEARAYALG